MNTLEEVDAFDRDRANHICKECRDSTQLGKNEEDDMVLRRTRARMGTRRVRLLMPTACTYILQEAAIEPSAPQSTTWRTLLGKSHLPSQETLLRRSPYTTQRIRGAEERSLERSEQIVFP